MQVTQSTKALLKSDLGALPSQVSLKKFLKGSILRKFIAKCLLKCLLVFLICKTFVG